MTNSPDDLSPVRSVADLTALWTALAPDLRSAAHSLWLVPLDRGGRSGLVLPLDDLPAEPGDLTSGLGGLVEHLLELDDDACVVAALSRPGPGASTARDRAWGRALHAQTALTRRWPLHLVGDEEVRVLEPDELLAVAS